MSDIRFNRWLHQSGTGGVSQDSSGNIGIGTTVPTMALDVRGDVNIGDAININNASGIISATTFTGTTGTFSGNVSGVDGTFTGNVSIAGTLTYEDVSNIDAVGIITAQKDVLIGRNLNVTGVSTFQSHVHLGDDDRIKLGASDDLLLYHDGANSWLINNTGDLSIRNLDDDKDVMIQSDNGSGGFETYIQADGSTRAAKLFNSGSVKFETTNTGAVITGILTATTFSGNLTGNVTGDLTGNLAGISSIAAISDSISDTAVDVFVYDTRKDSDGGAWRKRTQNTSWYNETLNTATRGSRKEFPAVAVIVTENAQVTIYDGDDPNLPMWMVFNCASGNLLAYTSGSKSTVMLNGKLANAASGSNQRFRTIDFISDFHVEYASTDGRTNFSINISQRNSGSGSYNYGNVSGNGLIDRNCNDVAMTVLPNAPIDSATGLPIPTIAIATVGGVSVIKDDRTVVDTTSNNGGYTHARSVEWASNGDLLFVLGNTNGYLDYLHTYNGFNTSDNVITIDTKNGTSQNARSSFRHASPGTTAYASHQYDGFTVRGSDGAPNYAQLHPVAKKDPFEYGVRSPQGLTHISENPDSKGSLIAHTTSSYNTGWMHGDIKGAFLSDTDIEDGVELVSNGTFDANTTGWTVVGGGSATGSSGQAQLTNNGTNNSSLDQTITTVVGKTYEVRANITPQGGGPMPRLYAAGKYAQVASNANSSQLVSFVYTATSTSTTISVNANTNVNNAVTLADNISVKLTNDVTSSNLISGATYTASDRITSYSYTNGSSTLVITDNPASADGYINLTLGGLTASTTYVLIVTANQTYTPTSGYNCHVGTTADGTVYFEDNFTGTASQNITFKTASSGNPTLVLYSNYNGALTYTLDLRLAEFDRSVGSLSAWNSGQNATIGQKDGLQVVGTVTKSPVATGAELVGYSGFTASNYLRYDASNMNFGTGDFSVSVWCVPSTDTSNEFILELDDASSSSNNRFYFLTTNTSTKRLYLPWDSDIAGSELSPGQWNHIVVGRKSGYGFVYVNSRWIADGYKAYTMDLEGNGFGTISNYSAGPSNDYAWSGSLALLRISGSAPSPEQIKKIYEDEKCLFHENAKVTLYGSSDAVTALAYDDTTNLLHVGTSAGRSEFQGLRRINNTTDAVTTAISASNGLVAEQ